MLVIDYAMLIHEIAGGGGGSTFKSMYGSKSSTKALRGSELFCPCLGLGPWCKENRKWQLQMIEELDDINNDFAVQGLPIETCLVISCFSFPLVPCHNSYDVQVALYISEFFQVNSFI